MKVMPKKYRIMLSQEERTELQNVIKRGKSSALKQRHARILLLADENQTGGALRDLDIAASLEVGTATVERVRRMCVEEGLTQAIERKGTSRHYVRKLDAKAEAQLIALACEPAPEGRSRWTLKLLADKLIELEVIEDISSESVRRTLKKTKLSLG